MFELKEKVKRIPDIRLGPNLDSLLRAKVNPITFLKEFKDNIVFFHLRDELSNGKWSESIGEGVVDFKQIGDTLETIKFKGEIIIELAHEDDVHWMVNLPQWMVNLPNCRLVVVIT
jgi:sugar phosphate isomerase/epimerase